MSILREDPFQRRRNGHVPIVASAAGHSGSVLAALMLVAIALMALSRLDHSLVRAARAALAEAGAPVLAAAMGPFRPVQSSIKTINDLLVSKAETDRLRDENQRLKSWQARAKELERRLHQLEDIARVIPEQRVTFATARVIADTGAPFARIALLDAGRNHGFRNGFPVVNADGLVGRIASAGQRSSRLLLVNDLTSRVPVYVGAASTRAIMIGDNGTQPKLAHLPADTTVEPGDDVITSGVGGVFPRGLRIGTVVASGDQLRVDLHAQLDRIEYVSVLFHDAPGNAFADEAPLEPRAARRRLPTRTDSAGGVP